MTEAKQALGKHGPKPQQGPTSPHLCRASCSPPHLGHCCPVPGDRATSEPRGRQDCCPFRPARLPVWPHTCLPVLLLRTHYH